MTWRWRLPNRTRSRLASIVWNFRRSTASLVAFRSRFVDSSSSLDGPQLLVGGLELLVGRLQLLVARLELLVARLELLVAGHQLLVGPLQLLVDGLELLVDMAVAYRATRRERGRRRR